MEEKTMVYEWLCDIATTLETLTEQVKGLANSIDLDVDKESEDNETIEDAIIEEAEEYEADLDFN